MSKKFYITTTLPYVNADPHIGFALEIVQADAIARYHRNLGEEVIFNTGTDEHGSKIAEAAAKEEADQKAKLEAERKAFGEGFRQHRGHAYPRDNILETLLAKNRNSTRNH